jgi:tetratricopeptide (TPR) repeat protein
MMKFSESHNYIQYINSRASGDLPSAKQAVQACLDTPEFKESHLQFAFLLQLQGDLYFETEDTEKALHYYQRAEDIDSDAIVVMYFFARFLAERIKDPKAALAKCDRIIAIVSQKSAKVDRTDAEYVEKATALKDELLSS